MKYGRGAQEPRGKHSAECFFCTCFSGDGLCFPVKRLLYRVKNSNPPARARRPRGRADAGREGVSDMARRLYKFIRAKEKNKFLNWIVELGSISAAARKMGLSRQAHYFWMHEDSDYRRAFAQAREMANDLIEEEAYRRAVEGQDVEIYYKGAKVGSKKVYYARDRGVAAGCGLRRRGARRGRHRPLPSDGLPGDGGAVHSSDYATISVDAASCTRYNGSIYFWDQWEYIDSPERTELIEGLNQNTNGMQFLQKLL